LIFLLHDYLKAVRENGSIYFQASASEIDKNKKLFITSNDAIDYDYSKWII
jgi:NADH dehydrogenase FAD-containing subunit